MTFQQMFKHFLILPILLLACIATQAQNQDPFTFYFQDQKQTHFFKDSMKVVLDSKMEYSANDILDLDAASFVSVDSLEQPNHDVVVWAKVKLVNKTVYDLQEHFAFCGFSDSIWFYRVENGSVIGMEQAGARISIAEKELPMKVSYIPYQLKASDSCTFLVKSRFMGQFQKAHYSHLLTVESKPLLYRLFHKYSQQSFYAGIIVLFALLGFFMFFTFREKVFIYFALLMLSFGLYFIKNAGILDSFIYHSDDYHGIHTTYMFTSAIFIFMMLFVRRYIPFKEEFPKLYWVYFFLTIYIALFPHITSFITHDIISANLINNYQILIWIGVNITPLIILSRRKNKDARVLLIAMTILSIGALVYLLYIVGILPANSFTRSSLQLGTIALAASLFYGLFQKITKIQNDKISAKAAQEKSDELLFNILPFEIAQELKDNGKAIAREFSKISVLFTDFKGFTQASEELTPEELVAEINTCFMSFDAICEKYQVEKIKTIGDAYMAAGGLPKPKPGSTKRTLLAALEMNEFILERAKKLRALSKRPFEMRIGIHTGPVIAGIVGIKKYQYDVWGDTVNTASRMESSGEAGRVNISSSTFELIKDDPDFSFEVRGKIHAKGKGEMDMYFARLKD
jgi:class 3 adenylate cyclase